MAAKGTQQRKAAGDTTPPPGVSGEQAKGFQPADEPLELPPDPKARHDGRFQVNWAMRHAGAEALAQYVADGAYEPRKVTREQLHSMVESVLRAINQKALGYAEGSIARNKTTGATARRYYSAAERRLVWLLVEAPTDGPLEVDKATDLPGGAWEVVYAAPWDVVK